MASSDRRRAGAVALALALLAGCAGTRPLPQAPENAAALCRAQIERVDHTVAAAETGDAGAKRIEGFPWLRVTRPLASLRDSVDTDARFAAWLERLQATAAAGRRHELANLPEARRQALATDWADTAPRVDLPRDLESGLDACRDTLNEQLLADPAARERLRAAAVAPDEYVTWQRVVGFYPIARRVARPQVVAYQTERAEAFGRPADSPVRRFAVPSDGAAEATAIARGVEHDALGIPDPAPAEVARLFDAHAPVWAVETESEADRPGALRIDERGRPVADTDWPAEYRRLSWTRFGDDILLQLNYMIWFPERPSEGWLDPYAGHLDGVIWRVTLAPDGEPLAYDSIHPCGCYYTLFPGKGWRVADVPADAEPVADPARVPAGAPEERVVVALDSATHYLSGIDSVERPVDATTLSPLHFAELRSLPRAGGGSESAFAPDGLVPSSARMERFWFWPFGVPSAGAMRQWGTHAIAFVGKRHFDDPRLLDRLLVEE